MIRVATLLAVLLLAQSVNETELRRSAPPPSGAHLDRHLDAHIAPREGAPAASPAEQPWREAPPEPAVGTVIPREPPPPAIQPDRGRSRDWR